MYLRKKKNKDLIPISIPYLEGNEERYLRDCVRTGWVSSVGPFVDRFEKGVMEYSGSKYALAVSSGTTALHTALVVLGIKAGEEIIVPTVTFIATANAVRYVGAHPIFMDCDDYLNIDVNKVKEFCEKRCFFNGKNLINKDTKRKVRAIIPVHILGNPADMDGLMKLAAKYHLFIVEDAAQSIGSYYTKGRYAKRHTGTIGHIGCYSFNGNKIITTGGGGMIVTNKKTWWDRARYLVNQAKEKGTAYVHNEIGYNYRMTNLSAAVGLAQLEKLDNFIQIKRKNFLYYKNKLKNLEGIKLFCEPSYARSNQWGYALALNSNSNISRDGMIGVLKNNGIEARALWKPNHLQKPYVGEQYYKIDNAIKYYERGIFLPCSVGIKRCEIDSIVSVIGRALGVK